MRGGGEAARGGGDGDVSGSKPYNDITKCCWLEILYVTTELNMYPPPTHTHTHTYTHRVNIRCHQHHELPLQLEAMKCIRS